MSDNSERLRVCVLGPFRIETLDGVNLTPKGAKNQALLALLALGPNMSRPRRWLADKLWSNFGAEQASANLRQALSKLRSALGPHRDILITDRHTVSLDERAIQVDLLQQVVPEDERAELLQGLDARDPEFSNWLRIERLELQKLQGRSQIEKGMGLQLICHVEGENASRTSSLLAEVISNRIGETISEGVSSWRRDSKGADFKNKPGGEDFTISTQVIESEAGFSAFVKIMHGDTARIVYSKVISLTGVENIISPDSDLNRIAFEAADHVLGRIPRVLDAGRPESRATALMRLAQYRMFSLDETGLREAQALALQAFQIDENGLYLAWASLAKALLSRELAQPMGCDLSSDALDLCRRALELSGDTPMVRALCSRTRIELMGVGADFLSETSNAVEANYSNAYAWEALAFAQLLSGDTARAYASSQRACDIASASPFKHWWDLSAAMVATGAGEFEEAATRIDAARQAAPQSRAVLRCDIIVQAFRGHREGALASVAKLQALEPGFSVAKMAADDTYPINWARPFGVGAALENLSTQPAGA